MKNNTIQPHCQCNKKTQCHNGRQDTGCLQPTSHNKWVWITVSLPLAHWCCVGVIQAILTSHCTGVCALSALMRCYGNKPAAPIFSRLSLPRTHHNWKRRQGLSHSSVWNTKQTLHVFFSQVSQHIQPNHVTTNCFTAQVKTCTHITSSIHGYNETILS